MNSFMSWIGGKKALRDEIVVRFPARYSRYIEVFGGGGWVLFHKAPGKDFEVYNDFNPNLTNLYRCVRDHPDELCDELRYTLNSRTDFDHIRNMLHSQTEIPDIKRAAYFYQLIRESYASGLDSFASQPHSMWNNFPLIYEAFLSIKNVTSQKKGKKERNFIKMKKTRSLTKPIAVIITVLTIMSVIATSASAAGVRWGFVNAIKAQTQENLEKTGDITGTITLAGTLNNHFKDGTKTGSDYNGHCWNHACEMSYLLFGVGIPSYSSPAYKLNLNKDWELVGCLAKPTEDEVWELLKKSKPGDDVQYVSSSTNPQHTVMVLSNNGKTVVIYEHTGANGNHVGTRSITKDTVKTVLGSFASGGISVARCRKALPYLKYRETAKAEATLYKPGSEIPVYSGITLKTKVGSIKANTMVLIVERGNNGTCEVARLSDGRYIKITSCIKPVVPAVSSSKIKSTWGWDGRTKVVIDLTRTNCTKVRVEVLRNGKRIEVFPDNGSKKTTSAFCVTKNQVVFGVSGSLLFKPVTVKLTPIYCIDGKEVKGSTKTITVK